MLGSTERMADQYSIKPSDLEKRLKILKGQVYGRQSPVFSSQTSDKQLITDIDFLKVDLLRISLLTSIALGVQIVLFFLSKNGFLKLNLF